MSALKTIEATLAPRAFPEPTNGNSVKMQAVRRAQTASDRLRDSAVAFGKIAVGLVPVPEFHDLLVDVLHDIVVRGEQALCDAHGVEEVEHNACRVLVELEMQTEPDPQPEQSPAA
jgi:hypothetical protein